jgi:hypothetical protein
MTEDTFGLSVSMNNTCDQVLIEKAAFLSADIPVSEAVAKSDKQLLRLHQIQTSPGFQQFYSHMFLPWRVFQEHILQESLSAAECQKTRYHHPFSLLCFT